MGTLGPKHVGVYLLIVDNAEKFVLQIDKLHLGTVISK